MSRKKNWQKLLVKQLRTVESMNVKGGFCYPKLFNLEKGDSALYYVKDREIRVTSLKYSSNIEFADWLLSVFQGFDRSYVIQSLDVMSSEGKKKLYQSVINQGHRPFHLYAALTNKGT